MKTYLDCIPCFMHQALKAGKASTKDETKIKRLLDNVGSLLADIPMTNTPPETGDIIYREVRSVTGVKDPYQHIKKRNIAEAKSLYPELKNLVNTSDNRLMTAIRIAIAGNVIDLGVEGEFNLVNDINDILDKPFAINNFEEFLKHLEKANNILYIGDNAGESVFDKILIEELGKDIIYVVRDIAVINDVTYKDALDSGIADVARIISSGTSAPGTILNLCNTDFLEIFENADMVISKGQGNYEGLSDVERTVFFLLKAKCHVIADDLNVKQGDIVLKISDYQQMVEHS